MNFWRVHAVCDYSKKELATFCWWSGSHDGYSCVGAGLRWLSAHVIMPAPNRRGHIAMTLSDVCLSVCLSRTSGLSREQRGLGRLKLAQR